MEHGRVQSLIPQPAIGGGRAFEWIVVLTTIHLNSDFDLISIFTGRKASTTVKSTPWGIEHGQKTGRGDGKFAIFRHGHE